MNERDFCYWLNGFFDLTEGDNLTEKQVQAIRSHLKLVFEQRADSVNELVSIPNPFKKQDTGKDRLAQKVEWPEILPLTC